MQGCGRLCFCIFYIIKCFFIYFYFVLFSVCLFVKLCMPCLCVFFNIGEVPWHCTEHLPRFSQRQAPAIVWRIVGEPSSNQKKRSHREVRGCLDTDMKSVTNILQFFILFYFSYKARYNSVLSNYCTFLLSVNRAYVNICHHTVSPFKDHKKMVKVKHKSASLFKLSPLWSFLHNHRVVLFRSVRYDCIVQELNN